MIYAFALFLVLLSLIAHECGHAIAMWRTGVGVKEMGLGLPFGPHLSYTLPGAGDPEKSCTLSLYPLLMGAFVRPRDEVRLEKLPYREKAFIFGAGILANIIFTLISVAILLLFHPEFHLRLIPSWVTPWMPLLLSGILLVCARQITAYCFPILSIVMLYFTVSILLSLSGTQLVAGSGGIVTIGIIAKSFSGDIWYAIYFGGLISFGLAMTNILPLSLLDGGLTIGALISRFIPRLTPFFNRIGTALLFLLILYSVGGDIRRLVLMT